MNVVKIDCCFYHIVDTLIGLDSYDYYIVP